MIKKICISFLLFFTISIYCEDKFLNDYIPENSSKIIKYNVITLSYNEICKIPEWTMYRLSKERSSSNFARREGFDFKPDKNVKCASNIDYKNSNYDKGHMVPAEDMRDNSQNLAETFMLTNVCPQLPDFNRGIWKDLEILIRNFVEKENRNVLIITGTLFNASLEIKTIGTNKVTIPHYFFKIVYDYENKKGIAYLIPQNYTSKDLRDYEIRISELESKINLIFFKEGSLNIKRLIFNY